MSKNNNKDQFFDFLLHRLEDQKEKIILELIRKYPKRRKSETRKLLKDALSSLKQNKS